MRRSKYFSIPATEDGTCYTIADILSNDLGQECFPVLLDEEKSDVGSGIMFCGVQMEFVERGGGYCGWMECVDYAPCNGKSGRCRYSKHSLTRTGRQFLLYEDGKLEEYFKQQLLILGERPYIIN